MAIRCRCVDTGDGAQSLLPRVPSASPIPRCPPSLGRVPMASVPRLRQYYEGTTTPDTPSLRLIVFACQYHVCPLYLCRRSRAPDAPQAGRRSDPLRRETAPLHARCRSPACPPSLRSRLLPTSPWKAVRPSAPGNRQAMPMIAMAGPNSENAGERASARACSSSPGPQDRPVSVIAMLSQSVGRQCLFIRYGTSFAGMRARRNHIRYILTGPH